MRTRDEIPVDYPDERPRRAGARIRWLLTAAVAAIVMVNAVVLWTYWRIADPASAGGSAVELNLRARSDLNVPLLPGASGNLTVTVTNDTGRPIRITALAPAPGPVVADDTHREAGCADTGVAVSRAAFAVSWDVPKNTVGAFTVPGGLTMAAGAPAACTGATFTVPVRVTGSSRG